MPAKSAKQARFMQGCAHNPDEMDEKCPPKSVAKEFSHVAPRKSAKKPAKKAKSTKK